MIRGRIIIATNGVGTGELFRICRCIAPDPNRRLHVAKVTVPIWDLEHRPLLRIASQAIENAAVVIFKRRSMKGPMPDDNNALIAKISLVYNL